jgi:hypothetical protein
MGSNKWLQLLQTLAPVILGTVNPALIPIAGVITHAISTAENSGKNGPDKLASVVSITDDAVQAINLAGGNINPSQVHEAVQEGVDTTIAVTNLIHNKSTF